MPSFRSYLASTIALVALTACTAVATEEEQAESDIVSKPSLDAGADDASSVDVDVDEADASSSADGGDAADGGTDGGAGPARHCPGGCFGFPEGACYRSPKTSGGVNFYVCKNGCLERVGWCS